MPIVDFSRDLDEEKLVESILDASYKKGIFQILNHWIPLYVISRLQKVGMEFFELPQEEKEVYSLLDLEYAELSWKTSHLKVENETQILNFSENPFSHLVFSQEVKNLIFYYEGI